MMSRAIVAMMFVVGAAALAADTEGPEGVLPVGVDGKPLNLDFETGTLKDWTADGEAFKDQPIKGDTVFARRRDMKSEHQGKYWVGTYEILGDAPKGTLTSAPFKVTHPWASFLVAGGPFPATCVELVNKETGEVFSRTSGREEENLRRVAVDLGKVQGKTIFIRVVDKRPGGWGHVNFDDFRFHSKKPNVPDRRPDPLPPPDVYKFEGLSPEKATKAMTVPEGFEVKLFAGEPDVHQPIAMCLDERGRVWVAEAYGYPRRQKEGEGKDRILIFEDADGDGKFDKSTVFMEGLNLVSGLEVGFGGVWIGAAPYLLFVPVKDGEDKPAGKPEILLDGWHFEDTHETLNTFVWGPDGWLYGCHGVFTYSNVGKPGTPDKERTEINAGVWRYHPTKHIFEVFAHGTSNPWGLDFNDHGQAFVEACVIPHCFHIIQGARYHRQAGQHFNKHTYADIPTIADHRHYVGPNPHGGNNRSDSAGGGHAHCGLMCYLGGSWPEEYRGQLFMGNIHGRRLNVDLLKPKGSGYVASHGKDFLFANDGWARFINFRYGPDGNVYLIDWYDKQACHRPEPEIFDRSNGRVYKVCYRGSKPVRVDLDKKSDKELVDLQKDKNDWYVRNARRLLQERAARKALDRGTHDELAKIAFEDKDETRRLRGLWTLHATGGLTEERQLKGLDDKSEHVRGWTVQLACEDGKPSAKVAARMKEMAAKDSSPVARLYLASAAQRLGGDLAWEMLNRGLLAHAEDNGDHNLPLMYWYAVEPFVSRGDLGRLTEMYAACQLPLVREFIVRRLSSLGTPEALDALVRLLARPKLDEAEQSLILRNMLAGLKGRRDVAMPKGWSEVFGKGGLSASKSGEVRSLAYALAVKFGDAEAAKWMRDQLASAKSDGGMRLTALAALLEARDRELPPVLQQLLGEAGMRGEALRGLAAFDDTKTPGAILGVYASLNSAEKRDALNTLASRASYGKALLDAVAAKKIAAADLPADLVRQLRNLNDKALDARIAEVWGVVRTTPADRKQLIDRTRRMITTPGSPPDLSLGRAVFAKTCQSCHVLFGVGGKVGPEITGANRGDLNYLLENILDPSAVITKEYAATRLELKNGRIVLGLVRGETDAAYTVVTATETLTISKADVDSSNTSATSMMPDDAIKQISDAEMRALVAYLQSPGQVPMLATADNAKDFFNGKDLTGWVGDPNLWKVEGGEIVGKTAGLKKNAFLRSELMGGDFRLRLKVRLTPDSENSGVQFRSEAMPEGEMKGYQADIGKGWWGKLYEEHGRALLWDKSGEEHVRPGEWNDYEIVAEGSRIKTFLNGKPCVDLDDPKGARRGVFAFQLHSGGPMEVRYKDLQLELLKK